MAHSHQGMDAEGLERQPRWPAAPSVDAVRDKDRSEWQVGVGRQRVAVNVPLVAGGVLLMLLAVVVMSGRHFPTHTSALLSSSTSEHSRQAAGMNAKNVTAANSVSAAPSSLSEEEQPTRFRRLCMWIKTRRGLSVALAVAALLAAAIVAILISIGVLAFTNKAAGHDSSSGQNNSNNDPNAPVNILDWRIVGIPGIIIVGMFVLYFVGSQITGRCGPRCSGAQGAGVQPPLEDPLAQLPPPGNNPIQIVQDPPN